MAGKPDPQPPAGLHNVLVYVSSDNFAAYAVNHQHQQQHHHGPPPPPHVHHGPQHVYCQNGAQPGFCVGKGRLLAAAPPPPHAPFAAPPLPLNGLVPPLYGAAPAAPGSPGPAHNGFPQACAAPDAPPLPAGLCLVPQVLGGKLVGDAADLPPAAGPAAGQQRVARSGGVEAEAAPRCDSVRSETSCSSLSSGSADSQPDGAAPASLPRPPPPPHQQQQQLVLAVHPHQQQVQSVAPPLGWKRLHIGGSIVYVRSVTDANALSTALRTSAEELKIEASVSTVVQQHWQTLPMSKSL